MTRKTTMPRIFPNEYCNELDNIPLPILRFSITFHAVGVGPAETFCDSKDYARECKERKVMPYTSIELPYNNETHTFNNGGGLAFLPPGSYQTQGVKALLAGGRIHNIKFSAFPQPLDPTVAQKGFEKFRESYLETMLKNDYYISHAFIDLSIKKNQCEGQIQLDEHKGVLWLPQEGKANSKMQKWYETLAKKYKARQK